MYVVGDRVILAFEPLVGEAGTVRRIWEGTAAVLLDARGPLGWPIIALVDFGEEPQNGLDLHL